MVDTNFFATPPKAERAFLSRYAVRIETEPLDFVSPDFDRELEPEIILDHLALPSIDPDQLQGTRYLPDSDCEGSFYFLSQHNWVDLKEIRFFDAKGDSILAEYDLVIHLPAQAVEYPITIRVETKIRSGNWSAAPPRTVAGLGTFLEEREDLWKGRGTYGGQEVEVEIGDYHNNFDEIATFAKSVLVGPAFPRDSMNRQVAEELDFLSAKFKRFGVSTKFEAGDFVVQSFYFYKRRHHKDVEMIIVLSHPADDGHWSLSTRGVENGSLEWVPGESRDPPRKE